MSVAVTLSAITLRHETGVWCTRCFLPSGLAVTLALELDGRPWKLVTAAACRDSGMELQVSG